MNEAKTVADVRKGGSALEGINRLSLNDVEQQVLELIETKRPKLHKALMERGILRKVLARANLEVFSKELEVRKQIASRYGAPPQERELRKLRNAQIDGAVSIQLEQYIQDWVFNTLSEHDFSWL